MFSHSSPLLLFLQFLPQVQIHLFLCLVFPPLLLMIFLNILLHPIPYHIFVPPLSAYSNASFATFENTIIQVHHECDDEFLQDVLVGPPEPLVDPVPITMSSRVSKRPSYLQAYHCNVVTSTPFTVALQSGTSHPLSSHLSYCSGPFLVKVGWTVSCGIGPECSGHESWDQSNYNSTWSGLCTNYASFAKNTLTAGKTVSNELRQTDMIIIIKSNALRSLLR